MSFLLELFLAAFVPLSGILTLLSFRPSAVTPRRLRRAMSVVATVLVVCFVLDRTYYFFGFNLQASRMQWLTLSIGGALTLAIQRHSHRADRWAALAAGLATMLALVAHSTLEYYPWYTREGTYRPHMTVNYWGLVGADAELCNLAIRTGFNAESMPCCHRRRWQGVSLATPFHEPWTGLFTATVEMEYVCFDESSADVCVTTVRQADHDGTHQAVWRSVGFAPVRGW